MAAIKHKMPNGRRKIDNYWIPAPIRELTLFLALKCESTLDSRPWINFRFLTWTTWLEGRSNTKHLREGTWIHLNGSLHVQNCYLSHTYQYKINFNGWTWTWTYVHWPTTIWWLDHMTMLDACAEAHAFATLMLWKGGILGVLLQEGKGCKVSGNSVRCASLSIT